VRRNTYNIFLLPDCTTNLYNLLSLAKPALPAHLFGALGECQMLKLAALFATGLAVIQCGLAERASKNDRPIAEIRGVRSDANARLLMLGLNEARAIDVPSDIREVLVGDLRTARVIVRTRRRFYIVGASVGRTSILFYDDEYRQIFALDISVSPQILLPELGSPPQQLT
jgi:Flp pilus assembly secretin CpaC